MRLFLRKNDLSKNPKIPYFTLSVPPEQDGGEWKDIGVFWKAKSGKGYTGNFDENVEIDISRVLTWQDKKANQAASAAADAAFDGVDVGAQSND